MRERIRKLRKYFGLNQTEFGEKIRIKQGTVAGYESGARIPGDAIITSICREYHCSEAWLRTGEEPMFPPQNKNEKIADFMTGLMKQPDSDEAKCFIETVSHLSADEWKLLARIAAGWVSALNDEKKESQD